MNGEILRIETVQEITGTKNLIERLKRDKNLIETKLERLQNKFDSREQRISYLEKINKIFELIETYLPHRINQITDKNDSRCDFAVLELKKLYDAIVFEKEKLLNKEVNNEENID